MVTKKAGCFLIRKESREVVVIYRKRQNDYSFPKGHVEEGETLKQTAVREVAEETKRIAFIIDEYEPFVEKYTTPKGEECACYMFFAVDKGNGSIALCIWLSLENSSPLLTIDTSKTITFGL